MFIDCGIMDLEMKQKDKGDGARNRTRLLTEAKKRDYILNPDQGWVDQILLLMEDSFREYGVYLCPCKQSFPPVPETDVCCPCSTLDEEVARDGFCHCRLFFKKGVAVPNMDILETISCPG